MIICCQLMVTKRATCNPFSARRLVQIHSVDPLTLVKSRSSLLSSNSTGENVIFIQPLIPPGTVANMYIFHARCSPVNEHSTQCGGSYRLNLPSASERQAMTSGVGSCADQGVTSRAMLGSRDSRTQVLKGTHPKLFVVTKRRFLTETCRLKPKQRCASP